ncbi:unnamed protein product [Auanema sp. JU1783]|nr:unnamed protein product [Auanema sp. JU1783]
MSCKIICDGFVILLLLVCCFAVFVLHSLYFIFRYTDNSYKEEVKLVNVDQLYVPAIVICNRMPFSQDGINSINSNIRQDQSIRYLREWTNPSLREEADYFPAANSFMEQGNNILLQYLSNTNRNETINRMEYQCQSVISSCSYQGVELSSYDCCRYVTYRFPSTNGMCWVWHDAEMWQNGSSVHRQFHMLFQISRNSWYSNTFMPTHPGIDIFLAENGSDIIKMAAELQNPIRLFDKRGARLRMQKEKRAMTRRLECGQAIGDAESADRRASSKNETNLLLCNIMVATRFCQCHPLLAELLPYDSNKYRDFSILIGTTNVCTVSQYDNCIRRYVDMSRPSNYELKMPREIPGYDQLEKCQKQNLRTCLRNLYPGTLDEYDLPSEYRNTQDFVARLTLEYTSMDIREVLDSKDPNLYEMLSFIGYNLALWFTIGYILWLLFAAASGLCCTGGRSRKVAPTRVPAVEAPIQAETEEVVEVNDGEI